MQALALLLSSYFVLNSMGVIDEAAVDRLYLIGELSKHISVSAAAAGGASVRGFLGASGASSTVFSPSGLFFFDEPLPPRRDIFDVGARAPFANEVRAEWSGASFLRPRVAPELAAGHRSGAAQWNV